MSSPTTHVLRYPWLIHGRVPKRRRGQAELLCITASHKDSPRGYIVHRLDLRPDRCATHDDCLQNHELGRDCWERSYAGSAPCKIVNARVDGVLVPFDMSMPYPEVAAALRIVQHPAVAGGGLFFWHMGSILSLYASNPCPIACEAYVEITVERLLPGYVERGGTDLIEWAGPVPWIQEDT
jgi:hypothetical protein